MEKERMVTKEKNQSNSGCLLLFIFLTVDWKSKGNKNRRKRYHWQTRRMTIVEGNLRRGEKGKSPEYRWQSITGCWIKQWRVTQGLSVHAELNAADRGLQRRKFHLCFSLYLDAARWDFHFVKDERQTIFPSQIFQCSLTKAHPWEVSSAQSWLSQLRPVTPPGVEGEGSIAGRSREQLEQTPSHALLEMPSTEQCQRLSAYANAKDTEQQGTDPTGQEGKRN